MRIVPLVLPTSYPVGPVNAYLLPGPPVTLVDCGPKTEEALAALEAALARAGSAPPGYAFRDLDRLIITHGHIDHFGLAATVAAQRAGIEICAHHADLPKLRGERWFVDPLRRLIREAGFGSDLAHTLLQAFREYRKHLDPITPTRLIDEGDRLELGSGYLEVMHTPGHAQGHISLRQGGTLVSGDLLLEEISPNPIIEFDADGRRLPTLPAYLSSLRRIEALAPEIAFPGHGEPITEPYARAREILRHHEGRKEALASTLTGRPWTLRELAAAWYPNLELFNLFLALSEIIGHLDLLEREGRVLTERRDGVLFYEITHSGGH